MTILAQDVVCERSCFVLSVEYLLGAIHTPRILEAWEGGIRSIYWIYSGEVRDNSALLVARLHLPAAPHTNSNQNHFVFKTLICSPVTWTAPVTISKTFCEGLLVLFLDEVG